MGDLKLNFLNDLDSTNNHSIVDMLEDFGKEICDYAKGYFKHKVYTTYDDNNILKLASLYILAPEILYEYKVVEIELLDIDKIAIKTYNLEYTDTNNSFKLTNGIGPLKDHVKSELNGGSKNKAFRTLINKIHLTRNNKDNSTSSLLNNT